MKCLLTLGSLVFFSFFFESFFVKQFFMLLNSLREWLNYDFVLTSVRIHKNLNICENK